MQNYSEWLGNLKGTGFVPCEHTLNVWMKSAFWQVPQNTWLLEGHQTLESGWWTTEKESALYQCCGLLLAPTCWFWIGRSKMLLSWRWEPQKLCLELPTLDWEEFIWEWKIEMFIRILTGKKPMLGTWPKHSCIGKWPEAGGFSAHQLQSCVFISYSYR